MRCKKHLADASSSVGICASCLRERLFALTTAEAQAQAQTHYKHYEAIQIQEDHRKTDTNPPPLAFPRSVSPYISRRKSDTTPLQFQQFSFHGVPDQRFFSTPHVGPNGKIIAAATSHKKSFKFPLLSGLFRSGSSKPGSDPRVSNSGDYCPASSSSSPSWFSGFLPSRRKKQSQTFSLDESAIEGKRRICRDHDRGMSPARYTDEEEDENIHGGSSGYSSETPRRTPAAQLGRRTGGKSSHNRSFSGMAFCLSPLVRASPAKPQLSNATSFCKKRSRKLVDFGRVNPNR